jgi:hypothetical protein
MPLAYPVYGIGEIFQIQKFFTVFCIPEKVLVAEMIYGRDFIPGPECRLCDVTR